MQDGTELTKDRPTPEVRAYFEALGRFVTAFAAVERSLFATSGQVARLPLPIAQAVFGSARVKDSIDRINKTMAASIKMQPRDRLLHVMDADFKQALGQLGLINTVRNEILHYGANIGPGEEWTVSNRHLKPEKPNEFQVSAALLNNMSDDLFIIATVLVHYAEIMGGREGVGNDLYSEVVHRPWHYKPAPPTGSTQQSQKNVPKHPPPPESSPG